uniref:Uncharacterized protein LOC109505615 n=1 Tax=Elaeis guineensis var. tenera TaxID=51953 RepID=A0A6J0PHR4_ELAGV|nr:uncharacterized protein LOC109505615 [Elaeis guineensis]
MASLAAPATPTPTLQTSDSISSEFDSRSSTAIFTVADVEDLISRAFARHDNIFSTSASSALFVNTVASVRYWQLHQMDMKNAFLNGDLEVEVYMQPPQDISHESGHVCHLRKALYGLKQAPLALFAKFSTTIFFFGFVQSAHDFALFVRKTYKGLILLLLYVDDIIITGDDSIGIMQLKKSLHQTFEMKDLGPLRYFLGLEVSNHALRKTDNKTMVSPLEPNIKLKSTDGKSLDNPTLCRQLVGGLVYLTITRPDITYAVHVVSQFMSNPHTVHFAVVLCILRYLRGNMHIGVLLPSNSFLCLSAYSDADWAGDVNDRKSTTGYCILLGDSLISWYSKKQKVI